MKIGTVLEEATLHRRIDLVGHCTFACLYLPECGTNTAFIQAPPRARQEDKK